MLKISGTITSIQEKEIGNHQKVIVTLNGPEKQKCFIDFRDLQKTLVKGYKVKDKVEITVYFEGKTSNGINHNKIIGKSINKII